jgi:hypothetical protein
MSVTPAQALQHGHRPRRWWRLVAAAFCLYVLALAAFYLRPALFGNTIVGWLTLDIALVAFAGFAASRDVAAARVRRPLRRGEAYAVVAAVVVVLLWAAGLLYLTITAGERLGVLALVIVIPVVPVPVLAVVGRAIYRRSTNP